MSEVLQAVLRMPPDLFWVEDGFNRSQRDSIRYEAANRIDQLQWQVYGLVDALKLTQGYLRNKGCSENDPLLLGAINKALRLVE